MGGDFKTNSDKSIIERLLEIPNLQWIKPAAFIPAKQQVLVQLTSDVVDMLNGLQPTVVQWATDGGMVLHFKVMAIMVPRVRNGDAENQSGIVHATGS
jgi:hypothetical protein